MGVLKNFAIFTRKHLYWKHFLIKVTGLQACSFIKKRFQHKNLPVNIVKFLRTAFIVKHLWWLLLNFTYPPSWTRIYPSHINILLIDRLFTSIHVSVDFFIKFNHDYEPLVLNRHLSLVCTHF